MSKDHFDVVVVGTGIAGIAVAHELNAIDALSWTVLEEKSDFGGTWDTFRYPGVRSDSDIDSYCFSFQPWRGTRPLGLGEEIRHYLIQAAESSGMRERTRFAHTVHSVDFDSEEALWHIRGTNAEGEFHLTSRWLHLGCGYYDHHESHQPALPGEEHFDGVTVDPQAWPEAAEHPANNLAGKHVTIIGSGATAVTVAPEFAAQGAEVTIVQRTANHLAVMGDSDVLAPLRRVLAAGVVDKLDRLRAIKTQRATLWLSAKAPSVVDGALAKHREKILSREEDRQAFRAQYPLWTQRVCRVPDGDLLHLVEQGRIRVITDTISGFEPHALITTNGTRVPTEILVKATGLKLQSFGGVKISVDGAPITPGEHVAWRGLMLDHVPNMSFTLGYVNDSYTLRAELVASFLARMLQHMRSAGYAIATPQRPPRFEPQRIIDLNSGYVNRGIEQFPVVSDVHPWTLRNNYTQETKDFAATSLFDAIRYEHRGRVEPIERVVDSTRVRIVGSGTPVLAVHGIGRGLEDFDELAQALVPRGFRVIAVDIPGFGASPRKAAAGNASMSELEKEIWAVADAVLEGQRPILLGHSLGGLIIQAMLLARPKDVAGLVMLAPSGFSQEITPIVKAAAKPWVGEKLMGLSSPKVVRAMEQAAYADPGRASEAAVALAVARAKHPDRAGLFADISKALLAAEPQQRTALSEAAGAKAQEVGVPVAILWGEQDKVISAANAPTAKKFFGVEPKVLAHCGHMLPIERVEVCAEVVDKLLERN